MNYLVLTLLILLSVFIAVSKAVNNSPGDGQSSTATPTTTPQPLTFDCDNGFVTNIGGINITNDALLVKNGTSGSLCHMTEEFCFWQNKTMLHVIYDPKEKDKSSKFVAGQLFRYELQCKSGYLSKANATALEINSVSTKKYFHEEHAVTPSPTGKIQVKIYKLDDTELNEKVHVGDKLTLKIIGPVAPTTTTLKPTTATRKPTTSTREPITSSPSNTLTPSASGRRRRRSMIKHDQKEDIATTSFTVVDSLGDSNGSAGLFFDTSLKFTMLLVCMYAIV